MYQMMQAIQSVDGVAPAMIIGGLRVSFLAPLYGLGIFALAGLLWLLLGLGTHRASRDDAGAARA